MNKRTKKRAKDYALDALFLCVGSAVGAFSTLSVMVPNGLTVGGITGIVRIIQNYFPFVNFSILFYAFAMLIWFICLISMGFKEARKIIVMTVIYPLFLLLFETLDFRFLESRDLILAAVYCGLFNGISNGLVFSRGFSFGTMDTICKIINNKLLPHVSVSKLLLCQDVIIILASGLVFGRNIALYAIITSIISARIIDYVLYGFETKFVEMEIISEHYHEISDYIINEVERGVSSSVIRGEYTGKERRKMTILCSPRESMLIKSFVAKTDRAALITVAHLDTVWGRAEGFRDIEVE
ncbi:MAG: YitT family protein [Clostridiales Family XIII bacterium]|nr:YitT family protein [Clostridiales Family XIII bacterium]